MARALNVQTPGAPKATDPSDAAVDQTTTDPASVDADQADPAQPAVAPDIKALVDAAVAAKLAELRTADVRAAEVVKELPTQDEATEQLMAEFKRSTNRPSGSVLTRDGWLALDNPFYTRQRDQDGFSKA